MQSQNGKDVGPVQNKEKGRPEISWKVMCLLCGVCFAVWALSIGAMQTFFARWETRGQFGDSFGAVNALFSAFAFAGVIYAIIIQQRELSLQVEELRDTREEFARQSLIMIENLNAAKEMQGFEKYIAHMKCEPIVKFIMGFEKKEIEPIDVVVPFNVVTLNEEIDDNMDSGSGLELSESYVKKYASISHVVYLANFGQLMLDVNVTCLNVREDCHAWYTVARLQRNSCLCILLPKDRFDCKTIQVELDYINTLGYRMLRRMLVSLYGGRSCEGYNSYLEGIGIDIAGYHKSKVEYESWLEKIKSGEDGRYDDDDDDDESMNETAT